MNLQEYINQKVPEKLLMGAVILSEADVVVQEVPNGWAVNVPALAERYNVLQPYLVKRPLYVELFDGQLWTLDNQGNAQSRSVFALGDWSKKLLK
jgi:hypothetical protein